MTDLWPRVEPLLARVERPARYIDREWGARRKGKVVSGPRRAKDAGPAADVGVVDYRVALVYPDTYELGMANQGLSILYGRMNALEGVVAERAYVPWHDMASAMREAAVPLFTLESCRPLRESHMVGITLPYELTYTNVLEVLDLSGIPLRAAQRSAEDPLVVAGGPCVYNPEPVAPFFDAILIGEGEEAVAEMIDAHRRVLGRGGSRAEALEALAEVPGVYVPSLYTVSRTSEGDFRGVDAVDPAPAVVDKRVVADLDDQAAAPCPVVPFMDVVHDRATVEVLRGCARGCRFCQAGMVYRPVRERRADTIVRDAVRALECTGYDEVSLTSLSSADHSQIEEVLRRLRRRLEGTATSVSLPSLRADVFSVKLARLVSGGKKPGLTFAPEAGTQRMRDVMNKNVTEADLLGTVEHVVSAGWRRIKLYFMIGLPTETDNDVRGIGELVSRVLETARANVPERERGSLRVSVSVTTFVPKACTPFQWEAQITRTEAQRRQRLLRETMPRRGIELSWHDAEVSFLEGVLARGGRELADAIEAAWRAGAVFDAWTEEFDPARWEEAFAVVGVDSEGIACRERSDAEPLPWDHVSAGVDRAFLRAERERALSGEITPDCTRADCADCGVCTRLGVANVIAGARA